MLKHNTIKDVRDEFARLLQAQEFVYVDKKSGKQATLEILGQSFLFDQEAIFGQPTEYVEREMLWYRSQSLNVNDIPGKVPEIWKRVADKDGLINSNYGWMIWSPDNYNQLAHVIKELSENRTSRRAIAIYNRPSMWLEYNKNGRDDFCCTNAVSYFVRDNKVNANVQMRSNDSVYGSKNDRFWQLTVLKIVADALGLDVGDIYWNASTLHIYDTHFYLVDNYAKTGEISIGKSEYAARYPNSAFIVR
jgi:thymidylate synthase